MDDVRVRSIPQAAADADSLQIAAGQMRDAKETLEAKTYAALMEAVGEAKEGYMELFREYTEAFEQSVQTRERLAKVVYNVIEDTRQRDIADANMFRGSSNPSVRGPR